MADPRAVDFYSRLGVDPNADSQTIKSAYSKAVRLFSPERFPEEFKRIREALETLTTADAREEYDARLQPGVRTVLEHAESLMANCSFDEAAAAFRRVLVVRPDLHFARNQLGLAYMRLELFDEALEQFRRLTDALSDRPAYWLHRAEAETALERYSSAAFCYRRARVLAPQDPEPILGLARVLAKRRSFSESEALLEQAIHADGSVDFDDVSYFMCLIEVRILDRDVKGVDRAAARLESLLRETWQYARVGYRFVELALTLAGSDDLELAQMLATYARRLSEHAANPAFSIIVAKLGSAIEEMLTAQVSQSRLIQDEDQSYSSDVMGDGIDDLALLDDEPIDDDHEADLDDDDEYDEDFEEPSEEHVYNAQEICIVCGSSMVAIERFGWPCV